jgi:hypothetical protein
MNSVLADSAAFLLNFEERDFGLTIGLFVAQCSLAVAPGHMGFFFPFSLCLL